MLKLSQVLSALFFLLFCICGAAFSATADHTKFKELQRNFSKPEDVTKACLSCHNLAGLEIMKTSHWLWERETDKMPGREGKTVSAGKKNIINNFCIALTSNEPRCTSCHIGYGWKDQKFDFTDQSKIDCLVCHESTGTYKKFPAGSGYPVSKKTLFPGNQQWYEVPEYGKVAQSVKRPSRNNCGTCHFYGGGGNAVKHGAMDKSLANPDKSIDIHMAKEGANMACVDCHAADRHDIKGQLFSVSSDNKDRLHCERCHTVKPHTQNLFVEKFEAEGYDLFKNKLFNRKTPETSFKKRILDKHIERISCQACHINLYSTKYKTKIWWDWSKAGQKNDQGKPRVIKDADGDSTYDGQKGEFKLGKNLTPEYFWFNGQAAHVLVGDKIDPENAPIKINDITGQCGEKGSKIWPFKVMRGKQLYDPVEKTFIVPKLFGPKGSGAYWADWDWEKASIAGMKEAGVAFSGKMEWIETEMNWPLTHLVRDKENSLKCSDCHSRNGRLAGLEACWIPGRDRNLPLDILGMIMLFGSIIGVSIHGFIRFKKSKRSEE
jgi:ribosomal protein S27AE